MARSRTREVATVSVAAVALGLLSAGAAAAIGAGDSGSTRPHIVARPHSVMVNSKTQLTGTGFPSKSTLTIEECSQTTWVVTQSPCDTRNVLKVKTDAQGRFHHGLTAETCPASGTAAGSPPGFSQTCYVGEPVVQGIDTETLAGAATITVTGP
jgi:hypothetical protein